MSARLTDIDTMSAVIARESAITNELTQAEISYQSDIFAANQLLAQNSSAGRSASISNLSDIARVRRSRVGHLQARGNRRRRREGAPADRRHHRRPADRTRRTRAHGPLLLGRHRGQAGDRRREADRGDRHAADAVPGEASSRHDARRREDQAHTTRPAPRAGCRARSLGARVHRDVPGRSAPLPAVPRERDRARGGSRSQRSRNPGCARARDGEHRGSGVRADGARDQRDGTGPPRAGARRRLESARTSTRPSRSISRARAAAARSAPRTTARRSPVGRPNSSPTAKRSTRARIWSTGPTGPAPPRAYRSRRAGWVSASCT